MANQARSGVARADGERSTAVETPRHLTPTGDCYAFAFAYLLAHPYEDLTLVHGRPRLQREPYCEFGHAWIESADGASVLDENTRGWFPRWLYHAIGQVKHCVRYTAQQAREHAWQTEHSGPWAGVDAVEAPNDEEGM